jgi:hypothetical protein
MDRLKLIIKSRRVFLPTLRLPIVGAGVTFPFDFSIRLPSLEGLDLGSRTKSIVVMSLVVSGLVIAGAIYFAIRGLDPVPVWPDAAVYDATRAQRLGQEEIRVGEDIPEDIQEGTMTLQLNIGGARIESIKFSDMSIGASGLTDAINISSSAGNILCEKLEFIDVQAPDFTMATSTAWSLRVATTTADGLSINPTLSSDPIKYAFGSTRGSLNVPDVSGGTFDRILISSNATSTVGLISFTNVKAFGAGITISGLNCGEVVIEGTSLDDSVYGDGTGIDSASFKIGGSGIGTVKVSSSTLIGNVERPVSVK